MHRQSRYIPILFLLLALGACGKEASAPSPPAPPQTPLIDLSTHAPATRSGSEPTRSSLAVSGDQPASPVAGQRTIGDIADRMGIAWSSVTSFRVTSANVSISASTPVTGATPHVLPPSVTVTDEFLLPGRRHRVQSEGGMIALELIVVDGAIYARGESIPGVTATAGPPVWTKIEPALYDISSPFAELYLALLQPVTAPYSQLSDDERERIARPAGTTIVNGRTCTIFETADTTQIGERVTILIAIGDDDLPCSIETHVANTVNVSTFDYNIPLSIQPPL